MTVVQELVAYVRTLRQSFHQKEQIYQPNDYSIYCIRTQHQIN
jgi:hypothetical protein